MTRIPAGYRVYEPIQPMASPELARRSPRTIGPKSSGVLKDFSGGVVTARAHHPAAGMGGCAAEIEPFDGRPIVGIARQRPHEAQAGEGHGTLHDVAAGQAKGRFEVA